MAEIQKQDLTSMNIAEEQLRKLKELFPEAFTEGLSVDWDKLRLTLGQSIDVGKERYGMNWPGKADCFKTIQQPSIATLIPAREESVYFDKTENLFIEGDNLEVLRLLQKSYLGKIKIITVDPPYNTGKEFIYPDNYSESLDTYLEYTGQVGTDGKKFGTNTDTDGRFHSKWLNMIYPRLFLAKNLLTNDGVIFISIGDQELNNLISICNEIFGEENRVGICARLMKSGSNQGKHFSKNLDYVLVYAKSIIELGDFREKLSEDLIKKVYNQIETNGPRKGEYYRTMGLFQSSLEERINQRFWLACPDGSFCIPPGDTIPSIIKEGEKVVPQAGDGVWRWTYDRYCADLEKGNIEFKKTPNSPLIDQDGNQSNWNIYTKIWLKDREEEGKLPVDLITKFENRHSSKEIQKLNIPFDFAKPIGLIKFFLEIVQTKDSDIVLDFFAGSSTSAHAVFEFNRDFKQSLRFIMVQLPEPLDTSSKAFKEGYVHIADISKQRIRRAAAKINEGLNIELEKSKNELFSSTFVPQILDLGFKVFKLSKSNFKIWDSTLEKEPEVIQAKLFEHINHISPEAEQEAILYELLLKSGFELTTPIEKLTLSGKTVFSIAEGQLLICLEKELTHDCIKAMAEMQPTRVICLDEGFKGENADALKTNAVQIMKSKGIVNFRTV